MSNDDGRKRQVNGRNHNQQPQRSVRQIGLKFKTCGKK